MSPVSTTSWAMVRSLLLAIGIPMSQFLADTNPDQLVCQALSASSLGSKVFYPGAAAYASSHTSYFSNQEKALQPLCVVLPESADDVSQAVNVLSFANNKSSNKSRFAIRSGGHTPFAGSANIQSGVTIDLQRLDKVYVSSDRTQVSIGTGAKWGDAYQKLDAMGLAISGGRAANIGVGGLTLGGGLSFFSPRKGFVCDNVISYELVLASGETIQASQESHHDLWVALRGGSNNFGIVTQFTLRAFNQGKLWGGNTYYDLATTPQQLEALYNFASAGDNYDEYATVIMSFGIAAGRGKAVVSSLEYSKPEANPPVFHPFNNIPSLMSTSRITNLTDITQEIEGMSAGDFQQLYITTTFECDLSMLQEAVNIWNTTVPFVENIDGIVWTITFQPLPQIITHKAPSLGGNSLGLSDQPALMIALLTSTWNNPSDDQLVTSLAEKLISDVEAEAKAKGVFNKYKYLNYAWKSQDVISGYGQENKERLREVSKHYDPIGLFQKAVPGGFKLS